VCSVGVKAYAHQVVAAVAACLLGACSTVSNLPDASSTTAAAPQPDPGAWKIARRIDPISGAPTATASLTITKYDWINARNLGADIILLCFKNEPVVRFSFLSRIGSNRSAGLSYRFDDKPGHTPKVRFLQDYKTVVIDDQGEVARFVDELAASKSLYLGITSLVVGRNAARFPVHGAPHAIEAAYASCPLARGQPRRTADTR
jgi:hypothetical protein